MENSQADSCAAGHRRLWGSPSEGNGPRGPGRSPIQNLNLNFSLAWPWTFLEKIWRKNWSCSSTAAGYLAPDFRTEQVSSGLWLVPGVSCGCTGEFPNDIWKSLSQNMVDSDAKHARARRTLRELCGLTPMSAH